MFRVTSSLPCVAAATVAAASTSSSSASSRTTTTTSSKNRRSQSSQNQNRSRSQQQQQNKKSSQQQPQRQHQMNTTTTHHPRSSSHPLSNVSSTSASAYLSFASAALIQQQLQQPYSWLFLATIEKGCSVEGIKILSMHPDSPSPCELLKQVVEACEPSVEVVEVILQKIFEFDFSQQQQQQQISTASEQQQQQEKVVAPSNNTNLFQRNLELIKIFDQIQKIPSLNQNPQLNKLMIKYFLFCGLHQQVSVVMNNISSASKLTTSSSTASTATTTTITTNSLMKTFDQKLWYQLLKNCANGKLRDTNILWHLVRLPEKYLQDLIMTEKRRRETNKNNNNIFAFLEAASSSKSNQLLLSSSSSSSNKSLSIPSSNTADQQQEQNEFFSFPISWNFTDEVCAHLLSALGTQLPINCATHIMLRYLHNTTTATSSQNSQKNDENNNKTVFHPVPLLAYLNCITQQKSLGRHCVHWLVPWRLFQQLNSSNSLWFVKYPSEAEVIVKSLIEILASSAPPSLAFMVARIASTYSVVDGVDIALHLMNRFHIVSYNPTSSSTSNNINTSDNNNNNNNTSAVTGVSAEVEKIVSKVFNWLVNIVEIHKRPARHAAVVLTARVLIRFGMTNELSELYSKVLDQASEMNHDTRESLLQVMQDLVCPMCCSLLAHFDVHEDRLCDNCLETVPAKPVGEKSSFELTQSYLKRVREKRKKRREALAKQVKESVAQMKKVSSASSQQQQQQQQISSFKPRKPIQMLPPLEAAELLRLQVTSPLASGVSTRTTHGEAFVALLPESLDEKQKQLLLLQQQQQSSTSSDNASLDLLLQAGAAKFSASLLEEQNVNNATKLVVPTGIHQQKGSVVIESASSSSQQQQKAKQQQKSISATHHEIKNVPWVCLWCNELNLPLKNKQENSSGSEEESAAARNCCACGADTGPAAPWRTTSSSQQQNDYHYFDPKKEIQTKIKHAMSTRGADDVISASYYIMMYRKSFLLRANAAKGDFTLVQALIELLVDIHEKTLAAYLFSKILPQSIRLSGTSIFLLEQLAALFAPQGASNGQEIQNLLQQRSERIETELMEKEKEIQVSSSSNLETATRENQNIQDDKNLFAALFGPTSCEHCFGLHPSHQCSIVTRNFASSSSAETSVSSRDRRRFFAGKKFFSSSSQEGMKTSSSSSLRTSPEEKLHLSIASISQMIDSVLGAATATTTTSSSTSASDETSQQEQQQQVLSTIPESDVLAIYYRFVISPNREIFATSRHEQANLLAQHLCRIGFPKRAYFVICHIPLELRSNECLTDLAGWFGLSPDDIGTLLSSRTIGETVKSSTHPNVIQLTRYCCVCFDGQHASHSCPRMLEWFCDAFSKDVLEYINLSSNKSSSSSATSTTNSSNYKRVSPKKDNKHRCVQVDGWISSGPERLYALYRFLLSHVDEIASSSSSSSSSSKQQQQQSNSNNKNETQHQHQQQQQLPLEITYALNKCVTRLVETNQKSAAWRLFARTPTFSLARETIGKILIMNGVEEMLVEEMIKSPTVGSDWLQLACPSTACLICFDPNHSFQVCPELTTKSSINEAVMHVLTHVGKNRSDPARAVAAAADYVFDLYQCGLLTQESIFRSYHQNNTVSLASQLASLTMKCFHFKMSVRGYHLLRRLPFSVITPPLLDAFWRGSGVSEQIITVDLLPKSVQYLQACTKTTAAKEALLMHNKSSSENSENNSSRTTILESSEFNDIHRKQTEAIKAYRMFLEHPMCRHCFQASHPIIDCDLFLEESSYGRDLISIFRVAVSHPDFSSDESKKLLLHLARYLVHFHRSLPFHVIGVARTMNSLANIIAMMHMPGVALRVLLSMPAAYRSRHAYMTTLTHLGVSPQERMRRSTEFLSSCSDPSDLTTVPESLMQFCSPVQDIALSHVFAGIKDIQQILATGDELLLESEQQLSSSSSFSSQQNENSSSDKSSDHNNNLLREVLQTGFHPRRPPQTVEISDLREAIDPVQRYIEGRVGCEIGSRHYIFTHMVSILEEETKTGGGGGGKEK